MKHTLSLTVRGMDRESALDSLRTIEGVSVLEPGITSGGLRSDSGVLTIVVDLAIVVLPALISALASIWAAKIASRSRDTRSDSPGSDSLVVTLKGEKEQSIIILSPEVDIAIQRAEWPDFTNVRSIKIEIKGNNGE